MFEEIFEVGGIGEFDYRDFDILREESDTNSVEITIRQGEEEKILRLRDFEIHESVDEESSPHVVVTMHGVYPCTTS